MIQKVRKYILNLLFIVISSSLNGQFNFEFSNEFIVKKGTDTLYNAWAGGLDYVQISDFDYDFDGDMDLFVFDRSRNNIRVFKQEIINGQPKWIFVPNAYQDFPTDLIYRATMIDFDADGKKDIFTYGIGGLKVYRNIGNSIDGLQWQLFKEIVTSDYNGFETNLYVASSDIPALTDVDFDGDLDVLTFHQGGQHVEYHKNMSMENYGIPDSLEFVLANECWGKFSENVNNNNITLNDLEAPCNGNGSVDDPQKSGINHAGSTLLAMDFDNSGVIDLIIGDVAYSNLVLLINGGTVPNQDSPMISADVNFPSNSLPADLYLFPAPFWVDVDFDGIKDLIIGANAKNVSENESSILFYKNTGTNTLPNFNFQTKSFLQNRMIEHGKGSVPILYDYNKDGLKDLFVANLYRFKNTTTKESTLAYYQNTGTSTSPVFTFVDADFLNLSQQNFGLRLTPTFGDIDDDGEDELIMGNEFGKLIFYENNGTTFVNPQQNFQDKDGNVISVGSFSYPQLFDLNKDGLLDLIIGNKTGELAYYQNTGSPTVPEFELITNLLGGVDVSNSSPDGYSTPHFFTENGATSLFIGDLNGRLSYYDAIDDSLLTGGNFHLYSNQFLGVNVEGYSSFFIDDTDNDGFLNLFIGQDLGGVSLMEVDPSSSASIQEQKELNAIIYPNPTNSFVTIKTESTSNINYSLIDVSGKTLISNSFQNSTTLDLSSFENGFYFITLMDEKGLVSTKKVLKSNQ